MISSCWGVLTYDRQMDGQTDEQTFVIVELLSRLKSVTYASDSISSGEFFVSSPPQLAILHCTE